MPRDIPDEELLELWRSFFQDSRFRPVDSNGVRATIPRCPACNGTGYKGRTGVYELLELDEAMADALRRNDTQAYIAAAARTRAFRPLSICALEYASKGMTTLDEVLRIAGEQEDTGSGLGSKAEKVTA